MPVYAKDFKVLIDSVDSLKVGGGPLVRQISGSIASSEHSQKSYSGPFHYMEPHLTGNTEIHGLRRSILGDLCGVLEEDSSGILRPLPIPNAIVTIEFTAPVTFRIAFLGGALNGRFIVTNVGNTVTPILDSIYHRFIARDGEVSISIAMWPDTRLLPSGPVCE
jgi:hypothetical protein